MIYFEFGYVMDGSLRLLHIHLYSCLSVSVSVLFLSICLSLSLSLLFLFLLHSSSLSLSISFHLPYPCSSSLYTPSSSVLSDEWGRLDECPRRLGRHIVWRRSNSYHQTPGSGTRELHPTRPAQTPVSKGVQGMPSKGGRLQEGVYSRLRNVRTGGYRMPSKGGRLQEGVYSRLRNMERGGCLQDHVYGRTYSGGRL